MTRYRLDLGLGVLALVLGLAAGFTGVCSAEDVGAGALIYQADAHA